MSASQARRVIAAERRARALEMRKAGASFEEIGAEVGTSTAAAHKAVQRALADLNRLAEGDAAELRGLELARLDALLAAVWPAATNGELPSVDRALKIGERRSKLLGLDAPVKHASTNPDGTEERPQAAVLVFPEPIDDVDEWVRQYAPQLPEPVDAPEVETEPD